MFGMPRLTGASSRPVSILHRGNGTASASASASASDLASASDGDATADDPYIRWRCYCCACGVACHQHIHVHTVHPCEQCIHDSNAQETQDNRQTARTRCRWLVSAGYPAAEAATALAASGGERDAALLSLYSGWSGESAFDAETSLSILLAKPSSPPLLRGPVMSECHVHFCGEG